MARLPQETRRLFRQWGRSGGRSRARSLSSTERSAIAIRAARARWNQQDPFSSVRLETTPWDQPVYLEEVLSEGGISDWRELYRRIAEQPFGAAASALEKVLASITLYGVTPLWKGLLRGVQGNYPYP